MQPAPLATRVRRLQNAIAFCTAALERLRNECAHGRDEPVTSVQDGNQRLFKVYHACADCGEMTRTSTSATPLCPACQVPMVDAMHEDGMAEQAQLLADKLHGQHSYYAGHAYRCTGCGHLETIVYWDR